MQACYICKKGTFLKTSTNRELIVSCSICGHGWMIPLTPKHVSPCHDPFFKPPEPRILNRNEDSEHEDYYTDTE